MSAENGHRLLAAASELRFAHGVNSSERLARVLREGRCNAIEADVSWGFLAGARETALAVMAPPPDRRVGSVVRAVARRDRERARHQDRHQGRAEQPRGPGRPVRPAPLAGPLHPQLGRGGRSRRAAAARGGRRAGVATPTRRGRDLHRECDGRCARAVPRRRAGRGARGGGRDRRAGHRVPRAPPSRIRAGSARA